jgi:hypothetical protein
MLFGKKPRNTDLTITTIIDGTTIDIVNQTKFLGIILDRNLDWKAHIQHLSIKLAKSGRIS